MPHVCLHLNLTNLGSIKRPQANVTRDLKAPIPHQAGAHLSQATMRLAAASSSLTSTAGGRRRSCLPGAGGRCADPPCPAHGEGRGFSGFSVQGSGSKVQGSGLRVWNQESGGCWLEVLQIEAPSHLNPAVCGGQLLPAWAPPHSLLMMLNKAGICAWPKHPCHQPARKGASRKNENENDLIAQVQSSSFMAEPTNPTEPLNCEMDCTPSTLTPAYRHICTANAGRACLVAV